MAGARIALTGGIATGKSTVARMFEQLGALILDADKASREAVRSGSPCWRSLKDFLGDDYFDADGVLKRRKVRELIIRDAGCRSVVNSFLHPAVLEAMETEWEAARRQEPDRVVIFDIPLLFEIGAADRFDVVLLVHTPREIQISRLMARDGLDRAEAEKTLLIQLPIDLKRSSSQIVIDNSQGLDNTLKQVREAWERLKKALPSHHSSL